MTVAALFQISFLIIKTKFAFFLWGCKLALLWSCPLWSQDISTGQSQPVQISLDACTQFRFMPRQALLFTYLHWISFAVCCPLTQFSRSFSLQSAYSLLNIFFIYKLGNHTWPPFLQIIFKQIAPNQIQTLWRPHCLSLSIMKTFSLLHTLLPMLNQLTISEMAEIISNSGRKLLQMVGRYRQK